MDADDIKRINMKFSREEIEEKTILFLENYFCGARGMVSAIFNEYLSNPLFCDYKLVWFAQDYDETVKKYGSWLDSERVWLCVRNGYDYVRYMNTAKYIFTADYFPNFYSKREGQVIYYAPADITMAKKRYTKAMFWRFVPTINFADHILVEKNTPGLNRFIGNYGSKKLVTVSSANYTDLIRPEKTVFFSFAEVDRACKSLKIFQYVYKYFINLASAYGYTVHWRIPLYLYKKLRKDEYISGTYKNIHSAEESCTGIMRNANLVVADNLCEIVTAAKYCDNLILFSNTNELEEEADISKAFCITNDFETVSDLFEIIIREIDGTIKNSGFDAKHSLSDCPQELKGSTDYKLINENCKEYKWDNKKTGSDTKRDVLIMTEVCGFPDMAKVLNERLKQYSDKVNLTVLYRGTSKWKGMLQEQLSDIDTDIPHVCRSGIIQCEEDVLERMVNERPEGRKSDEESRRIISETAKKEWSRILGKTDYDYGICITGKIIYWLNMYEYIPALKYDFYTMRSSASETVDSIEKLLKEYIDNII